MTNAEKFLKDGTGGVQDFTEALMKFNEERKFVTEWYAKAHSKDFIDLFLNKPVKPTLTEDERVILRNLQPEITLIGRNGANELFIAIDSTNEFVGFYCYDHLFQFIKERRRILY